MNSLVIYGRPTTKKNSSRVVMAGRYPRVLPSKAFTEYEKLALQQLQFYRKRFYVAGPVHVRCRYYMPDKRSWPDLVGLLQATSDILTDAKLIDDDKWIVHYDGSCIAGVDKSSPRVEIDIIPIAEGTPLHDLKRKGT
jgi:crossover junction endodeoxyribonuclease rusA superfamily